MAVSDDGKTIGRMNGPWAILLKLALVIFIPFSGWMSLTVISLQQRVAVIESTYLTNVDALEIWKEIDEVKRSVATLPSEVPPAWFLDRFNRLEIKVDNLENKIDEIRRAP